VLIYLLFFFPLAALAGLADALLDGLPFAAAEADFFLEGE
jgi:hypothetical protein